jgi:hypothetical protein
VTQPQFPQAGDVVRGGQPAPLGAAVLGGLDGVRQRFKSDAVQHRLAAVIEAQRYGAVGLPLLIAALEDPAIAIQKLAYASLHHRAEPEAKQALQQYEVYRLFECLYTLEGHTAGVTAVAISADARIAISGSRDRTLCVWDLEAREVMMSVRSRSLVYAIAISPDSRYFTVKGDRALRAWDLRTGQQISAEELPTRHIASVTVSANKHRTRNYLFSGSQNTIKVWNLAKGREVCTLHGHTSLVTSVAIAPKHQLLASGSEDQTVKIWGIP